MLVQSLTKNGLQKLLDICVKYFRIWRLDYNVLKSLVIVFNELLSIYNRSGRRWYLGNEVLHEGTEYKNLGIVFNKDAKLKQNVTESASSIRKLFFGLVSCGFSELGLHALTLKRIYESVVLPRALYGSELWSNFSKNDIMLLERSHRLCVKTMQNMDRNTRTCVALSSLGMMNLNYVIVKRKLMLFGQLCKLDTSYAAKKTLLIQIIVTLSV